MKNKTFLYENTIDDKEFLHEMTRQKGQNKIAVLVSLNDTRRWSLRFGRDYILYKDKRLYRHRTDRKLRHTVFEYKIPHDGSLVSRILAKKRFNSLHEKINYKGRVSQHLVSMEGAPFKYFEKTTYINKGKLNTCHD